MVRYISVLDIGSRKGEGKMVKRLLIGLALIFIFGSNVRAAEKFAYINLEKVFNEYQKTKDEEAKLTEEGKQKQKEIDAKIKEIDKLREDVELLNEKERERRKAEIEKKMQELRQFDRQARADLMRKRDAIIREILTEIDNAIKEYGRSKGYTLIFNSRALLYKDERLDITDEIIKYLNNKYKKEKKK